jgi:hypothetical protein
MKKHILAHWFLNRASSSGTAMLWEDNNPMLWEDDSAMNWFE